MHCGITANFSRLLAHHYIWGRQFFLHFPKGIVAIRSTEVEFWEYLFKWRPSSILNIGLFYPLLHCGITANFSRLLAHHYIWGRQFFLHFPKGIVAIRSPEVEFWEYVFKWRPSSSLNIGLFYPLMHCNITANFNSIDYWGITIPGDVNFYIS
jgi:hypothetical protein